MPQVVITITSGAESKGLRIKPELVDLYVLDATKVRDFIILAMGSTLFDSAITAQMIQDNIEEID